VDNPLIEGSPETLAHLDYSNSPDPQLQPSANGCSLPMMIWADDVLVVTEILEDMKGMRSPIHSWSTRLWV